MRISELIAHSYLNRKEVETSHLCACFNCMARFAPSEILLWTDTDHPEGGCRSDSEGYPGRTAICPKCENDDVLGDACGIKLTEDVLKAANSYWHKGKYSGNNQ